MGELPPLTPLPRKKATENQDPTQSNPPAPPPSGNYAQSSNNVRPSELFNPPPSNPVQQNITQPVNFEVPTRNETEQQSPALYQGEPGQQKYFETGEQSGGNSDDIFTLRKQLEAKEKELDEIYGTFKEIKGAYETLNISNENYRTQIDTLKASIEMKETQITTLNDTIKMKNELIAQKDNQIQMKEDQIGVYQQSNSDKKAQIERMEAQSVSRADFEGLEAEIKKKDAKIEELSKKITEMDEEAKLLRMDIDAADDEVEELTQKIEQFQNSSKKAVYLRREQVIERVRGIIEESLHNLNITVPTILDLAELELYNLKSSVNVKISCDIDISNPKHAELLEEYSVFDNFSIRQFSDQTQRWSVLRDGEYLFFAVEGKENNKLLAFSTEDDKHIKLFNSLVMESWLRAKKIN